MNLSAAVLLILGLISDFRLRFNLLAPSDNTGISTNPVNKLLGLVMMGFYVLHSVYL
jgi:hypothetical protein